MLRPEKNTAKSILKYHKINKQHVVYIYIYMCVCVCVRVWGVRLGVRVSVMRPHFFIKAYLVK